MVSSLKNEKIQYPPKLQSMLKHTFDDQEDLLGEIAGELHWFRKWDKVLEWNPPDFTWFKGGVTNLATIA